MPKETGIKRVAENRKARHDYFIDDTFEAGIALVGTEVKSLREGRINLRDSYVEVRGSAHAPELFLVGAHISPYDQGNIWNHDPLRARKLLMHRHEIERLATQGPREGLHRRADQGVLQGRARQGRDRSRRAARSSTTSATTWPTRTPSGTCSVPSAAAGKTGGRSRRHFAAPAGRVRGRRSWTR